MKTISAFFAVLALCSCAWAQAPGEDRATDSTSIEQKLSSPAVPTRVVYPEQPHKKYGRVHLRATINEDGTVTDMHVVTGKRETAESALEAIRQWRYRPAKVNGAPVQVEHDFLIDFTKDNGVMLGPDDLAPDLPTEPLPEVVAMLKEGELSRIGKKVSAPKAIKAPDPEYSERARQAKYSGVCEVTTVVGSDGLAHFSWVTRPIGEQLDERALETLKQWKFAPAKKDGKPVPVLITVEFKFDIW